MYRKIISRIIDNRNNNWVVSVSIGEPENKQEEREYGIYAPNAETAIKRAKSKFMQEVK